MRLNDLISGFVDPNADEQAAAPEEALSPSTDDDHINDDDDDGDDDGDSAIVDTGPDPEEARRVFAEMEKTYSLLQKAIEKGGSNHARIEKLRNQLEQQFVMLKLVPRIVEILTANLRRTIDRIRAHERSIMDICIKNADMPRKNFITSFPDNETRNNFV